MSGAVVTPAAAQVAEPAAPPPVAIEPLRCHGCGAAVPLRSSDHVSCPSCNAKVAVPARYRELLDERAREEQVRKALETRYAAAARPPARWISRLAVALELGLPAAVGAIWMGLAARAVDSVELFTAGLVPALIPGSALWLWSAAVHATIVRFELALGMRPPNRAGGPSRCRECGAPLDVPAAAMSVRCPYCATDNLVVDVTPLTRQVELALGKELRTLGEAAAALRLRGRLLAAGAVLACALFALVVWAVGFAYAHTPEGDPAVMTSGPQRGYALAGSGELYDAEYGDLCDPDHPPVGCQGWLGKHVRADFAQESLVSVTVQKLAPGTACRYRSTRPDLEQFFTANAGADKAQLDDVHAAAGETVEIAIAMPPGHAQCSFAITVQQLWVKP